MLFQKQVWLKERLGNSLFNEFHQQIHMDKNASLYNKSVDYQNVIFVFEFYLILCTLSRSKNHFTDVHNGTYITSTQI